MSITRRNAITGATAAVAVAAVPVTVQANDDHIAALYAEWRGAEAQWLKANAVADDAHLAALRACREGATYRAHRPRVQPHISGRRRDCTTPPPPGARTPDPP
jgi:hypothetical protein